MFEMALNIPLPFCATYLCAAVVSPWDNYNIKIPTRHENWMLLNGSCSNKYSVKISLCKNKHPVSNIQICFQKMVKLCIYNYT